MECGREVNMNLEFQVVSFQLAKEMKELGYKQEGLWWRYPEVITNFSDKSRDVNPAHIDCVKETSRDDLCVAPTVAELGEALPNNYGSFKDYKGKFRCFEQRMYHIINSVDTGKPYDTEADARAKMWIYLKKEELI